MAIDTANDFTLLTLSGVGVPEYSARGAQQTLEPIAAAQGRMRRSINGAMVDLGGDQFQKYASTITCTDQNPPAVDGVWEGQLVTVDCVRELACKAGGTPQRTVVPGSQRTGADGTIFYRPRLSMVVLTFNLLMDEYPASTGWTMALEEA